MSRKRFVMVVDDQPINRKILERILDNEYEVLQASNGAEALQMLEEQYRIVSAILLDLMMPVLDGYGVLKKMRKDSRFQSIPVIITTQKEGDSSEIEALNMGANDFVSKPYHPEVIRLRLRNLIQMREAKETVNVLEIDTLTGLINKEALFHKVTNKLEKANAQYEMVAGDIEKFKIYNDTFGDAAGDELLQYVAKQLQEVFAEHDCLISRGYADQFFLFIKQEEKVNALLEKVCERIKAYPSKIKVVMKFGIYSVDSNTVTVRAMCDRAVLAASTIKGQYDLAICNYNDSLREKMIREQQISSIMNEALEQKQFKVYYQPKHDADTEYIVGAEALVRWIHPEYGFMSPGDFIPLFEKNGFITQLDMYIWEEVCAFLQHFQKEHDVCMPISVNVSRRDIYSADLPKFFMDLVKKYELDPKYLHLEVTETAYTDNPKQLLEVVKQLKDCGFAIEMDDFGSGYSSLNMLSEMPIDILKLDMKFIQNEQMHRNSNNIINSVINLAKWMNLLVIAEGVETKDQLDYLRELKCNIIQGYYFAKPMPQDEFFNLLEHMKITPVFDVNSYINNTIRIASALPNSNIMLVIDDLAMNRAILNEYFTEDYSVEQMENGAYAWEFIKQHYERISVIMLDLYMPGMDGFELLKRLKENEIYKNIPVIITTMAGEKLDEVMKELHADGFLAKPYEKEGAIQIVSDVLAKANRDLRVKELELKRKLKEAEKMAARDGLTGLLNRSTFEKKVAEYARETPGEEAIFIMLDIDNFKEINDSLGHIRGDEALQTLSTILNKKFRSDDLIGRMGGDEFAILVKAGFDEKELCTRMEAICQKLNFTVGSMHATCSLGVCTFPKDGNSFEQLYHHGDEALLLAKAKGKNQYQLYKA